MNSKKKKFNSGFVVLALIFFGLYSTWATAQEKTIDSLLNVYKKDKIHDSLHIVKITGFLIEHSLKDYNHSKSCLELLLQSKGKFSTDSDKAAINYAIGVIYYYKSDFINTIKYTQRAIQIAEKLYNYSDKKRILESAYGNLGLSYLVLNDYEGGYETILKALPYALEGHQKRAVYIYNFLAYAQKNLKNYKRAEELALKGLRYRSKCTDEPSYVIGTVATLLSIKEKTKNFSNNKLAEKIIDSVWVKNKNIFNNEGEEEYYALKGDLMRDSKNYKKAIEYFNLAIKKANIYGFAPSLAEGHFELGRTQAIIGLYKEAEKNYEISLKFADKNDPVYYLEILEEMARYYFNRKNYVKSSFYFDKHLKEREAYMGEVNNNLLQVNDTKYQLSEKEKRITELNEKQKKDEETHQKRKNWIIGLLTLLTFLGVSFYALFRNFTYRRRIADQEIVTLKQAAQLTATESIIKGQEEERSRLAKDLHDGLGGILSSLKYSLTSMTGNFILTENSGKTFTKALETLETAISEMRRVAHSMMPEALLKFGLNDAILNFCEGINQHGKLQINFQAYGLENRLEQSVEITIFRIVQELLNNAMKHSEASKVLVQLTKTNETLVLTVEDNGKGFDKKLLEQNKGAGISNIESRVSYLNGQIEIDSNAATGTSIIIEIPIKKE